METDNQVPQPWLVEVISRDPTQPVRQLPVAADGSGSLSLRANESVIVAVAGLASDTSQQPAYQLRLVARSDVGPRDLAPRLQRFKVGRRASANPL